MIWLAAYCVVGVLVGAHVARSVHYYFKSDGLNEPVDAYLALSVGLGAAMVWPLALLALVGAAWLKDQT